MGIENRWDERGVSEEEYSEGTRGPRTYSVSNTAERQPRERNDRERTIKKERNRTQEHEPDEERRGKTDDGRVEERKWEGEGKLFS
jgi:hypothetical protein